MSIHEEKGRTSPTTTQHESTYLCDMEVEKERDMEEGIYIVKEDIA